MVCWGVGYIVISCAITRAVSHAAWPASVIVPPKSISQPASQATHHTKWGSSSLPFIPPLPSRHSIHSTHLHHFPLLFSLHYYLTFSPSISSSLPSVNHYLTTETLTGAVSRSRLPKPRITNQTQPSFPDPQVSNELPYRLACTQPASTFSAMPPLVNNPSTTIYLSTAVRSRATTHSKTSPRPRPPWRRSSHTHATMPS